MRVRHERGRRLQPAPFLRAAHARGADKQPVPLLRLATHRKRAQIFAKSWPTHQSSVTRERVEYCDR